MSVAPSRSRRPGPPPDPCLPVLGLMAGAGLGELLTSALPPDARAQDLGHAHVGYVEYSPLRSVVIHVSARVGGRRRTAVVRAGRAVTAAALSTGVQVPALDAVVHWLPLDPALPLLAASDAELRAVVRTALPAGAPWLEPATPASVLAYVPGQRATLALAPYVLKSYGARAAFEAAESAALLLTDGCFLPTPRHLGAIPAWRTTVQELVAGTPARRLQAVPLAAAAGRLLSRLHVAPPTTAVERDPDTLLREAGRTVEVLAAVLPDQASLARALLARLADTLPTDLPLVLSHGDFSIDQLLVEADGGLVVTDLDSVCRAPAALDLATFAANVVSGRAGDDERCERVLAGLVEAHGTPPALRWHLSAALLRRCDRPFRRLKKDWPDKATRILDLTQRVSTSC